MANRFLHAWQVGNVADGMVLLGDSVRHAETPEKLETFFSPGTERGFELGRGTGRRGRYEFPVALLSPRGSRVFRRATTLVVVSTGKNDWVIDKLP